VLLCTLLVAGVLGVSLLAGALLAVRELSVGNIQRIATFPASAAPRPLPAAGAPLTFLLIGSDGQSGLQTTGSKAEGPAGAQRSDSIMLVRTTPGMERAVVVSIPRDAWVRIPGHGLHKINAAYAYGGAPLLIRTVEELTGVKVDHFGAIDFVAFARVTDAFGGVDVKVARDTSAFGVRFDAAGNHLNGEQALAYVRQRNDLPEGDLDRVRRHQSYLRAMIATTKRQLLQDPGRLPEFIAAITRTVSIDDRISDGDILRLAFRARKLRPENVTYLTAPVAGYGREGAAEVVYLDRPKGKRLWAELRDGPRTEQLAQFGALPAIPR
jgi:LCP family protein required for cell wall assembly